MIRFKFLFNNFFICEVGFLVFLRSFLVVLGVFSFRCLRRGYWDYKGES